MAVDDQPPATAAARDAQRQDRRRHSSVRIPRRRGQAAAGIFRRRAYCDPDVPNGLLRKYSLCNDPAERDRYLVAVKREANGRGGSANLIDKVKAGDELMVAPPVNDFGLPPRAQDFLFIAGGIGITPIMAMIREVRAQGKRFRLFYCSRSPETTAFHRRAERAGIQGQRRHPLRRRRSRPLARSQADPGGAEKPRASVLLRPAPADGGGART